ncbi:unnamed protein product [Sphenostylis stenocarpa]|uniref:Uncharacterized protein n=1 Tax=Sphenostylis stenocarpa TaxID=92480 RepID=A0AA86VWZ3_9FABA|nr:unnamed protein product [Sphenostylis stenocarpa]
MMSQSKQKPCTCSSLSYGERDPERLCEILLEREDQTLRLELERVMIGGGLAFLVTLTTIVFEVEGNNCLGTNQTKRERLYLPFMGKVQLFSSDLDFKFNLEKIGDLEGA